jgi:hypothetical protein
MPVQTRSQHRNAILPEGFTRAYKIVNRVYSEKNDTILPIVAVLIIPSDVSTNMDREIFGGSGSFSKYRSACAYVEDFLDLAETPIPYLREAYSIYSPSKCFVYKKGQFIYPDNFNPKIEKICGGGIHFFKTFQAAIGYYVLSSNSVYLQKQALCPGYVLPFDIHKNVPNGKYNIYNDNGHFLYAVEYKKGMIRNLKSIRKEIEYNTLFDYIYRGDSITVKTETTKKNCKKVKYTTLFEV